MAFQAVEYELQNTILPALFQEATSQIPRRAITNLPVKQAEIALPDQTWTAGANWMASCLITGHLCRTAELRSGDYALLMGEGREDIQQRHAEAPETYLGEARDAASKTDARPMGRIHPTGA